MRGSLRRALFLLALLLAWEAASRLGLWRAWVFPSPSAIGASLWAGVVDGTIPRGIAHLDAPARRRLPDLARRRRRARPGAGALALAARVGRHRRHRAAGAAVDLLAAAGAALVRPLGDGDPVRRRRRLAARDHRRHRGGRVERAAALRARGAHDGRARRDALPARDPAGGAAGDLLGHAARLDLRVAIADGGRAALRLGRPRAAARPRAASSATWRASWR